jgi:hypothetical protein
MTVTSFMSKAVAACIVLFVLGVAGWAGPAAAQQPSQAQITAIRQACRADYQMHCAAVPTGGSASLACLKKNVAVLSPGCQQAVGAVGGSAAPARPSGEAPSVSPSATVSVPAPEPLEPPPATAAEPAAEPPASPAAPPPAIASAPAASPAMSAPRSAPPRLELAVLRGACGQDYWVNCPGVRPGRGQVIACLVANGAALSPRCQRALVLARQGM